MLVSTIDVLRTMSSVTAADTKPFSIDSQARALKLELGPAVLAMAHPSRYIMILIMKSEMSGEIDRQKFYCAE